MLTMVRLTIILFLFLFSCKSRDNDNKNRVLTLKDMSDLATVEYRVTKIIKASDNKTWYKLGDRKILMSCEATIKAGIDMSQLDKNNFQITDKSIKVNLPQPKIISINIPVESIKTEYMDVGILRSEFSNAERYSLATQAEQQIKASINELGILDQAKANTAAFVTQFLRRLGYEKININYNSRIGNERER